MFKFFAKYAILGIANLFRICYTKIVEMINDMRFYNTSFLLPDWVE